MCVCVSFYFILYVCIFQFFSTVVLHLSNSTLLLLHNLFHINVVVLFIHSCISFFLFCCYSLLWSFYFSIFSVCLHVCVCVWSHTKMKWEKAKWHVNRSEYVGHYLTCLPVCMHACILACPPKLLWHMCVCEWFLCACTMDGFSWFQIIVEKDDSYVTFSFTFALHDTRSKTQNICTKRHNCSSLSWKFIDAIQAPKKASTCDI